MPSPEALTDAAALPHASPTRRTRLLVSVRDGSEAEQAIAGGADLVDLKEPRRGPLGRVDASVLEEVLAVVSGRAPVTAAAGELVDLTAESLRCWLRPGVALVKFGLAGADADWRRKLDEAADVVGGPERCVPVAYADWRSAAAPPLEEVLSGAAEAGCGWLLVDTFSKADPPAPRGLLHYLDAAELGQVVRIARRRGLRVALAGQLSAGDLNALMPLAPDVIGVRGAACVAGRASRISVERVRRLREACEPAWPGTARREKV